MWTYAIHDIAPFRAPGLSIPGRPFITPPEVTTTIRHEYNAYKCPRCHSEVILVAADQDRAAQQGRYINCPYCGSKQLDESGQFDDITICLNSARRS